MGSRGDMPPANVEFTPETLFAGIDLRTLEPVQIGTIIGNINRVLGSDACLYSVQIVPVLGDTSPRYDNSLMQRLIDANLRTLSS